MLKLEDKDIKMLRGISTGAGIFTLIVALSMLFSLLQLKAIDPIDNQAITTIKEQYDKDPDSAVKAEQVRTLDLMARKAYFASRRQVETGSYLLLAGAVIFVICQRLIAGSEKELPSVPGERTTQSVLNSKYAKYLTGAVAVLTVAAIGSSFLLRKDLPDLSGRKTAKAEKKAKSTDGIKAVAETYKPDDINFPFFRGENGRAVAGGSGYPVDWNGEAGKNIKWKTRIPMEGKSSPVIWGDKVFLTGSEGKQCELYCFNKKTGAIEWTGKASGLSGEPAAIPETDRETGIAASTAATDGKVVCAIFGNGNLVCYDVSGKLNWSKNIGTPANAYGYSCSLIIYKGILVVQFDSSDKIALQGYDTGTGELKYETLRRGRAVWSSPVMANFNNQIQVVVNGNPEVTSFDPQTGKELWTIEGVSGDVAPSLAVNSSMIYTVTDYAKLAAIKPGPGPAVVWADNMFTPDVSSPVATDNFLFLATGNGDVACYNSLKGDTLWTHYFSDQFYASPIVADEKVWILDRSGVMHIVKAGPQFELIAESPIGEPADCTPAFSEKSIFIRSRNNLFCISGN